MSNTRQVYKVTGKLAAIQLSFNSIWPQRGLRATKVTYSTKYSKVYKRKVSRHFIIIKSTSHSHMSHKIP